jgi:hypothetical protein
MTNDVMAQETASAAAEDRQVVGVLAEFPNPGVLLAAARSVRDEGYRRFDTYSPFPIHGMDKAMGLGNSKLGYLVFVGGLAGAGLGYWLQWWTGAVDYPLNISGKPFFALWPSVPIIFELTVLFAATAAVVGMLAFNGLPRLYNPIFNSERFAGASDDQFFLQIEARDDRFDREATAAFLEELGAVHVEPVWEEEEA